jgi:hypothetical protein
MAPGRGQGMTSTWRHRCEEGAEQEVASATPSSSITLLFSLFSYGCGGGLQKGEGNLWGAAAPAASSVFPLLSSFYPSSQLVAMRWIGAFPHG